MIRRFQYKKLNIYLLLNSYYINLFKPPNKYILYNQLNRELLLGKSTSAAMYKSTVLRVCKYDSKMCKITMLLTIDLTPFYFSAYDIFC